MKPVQVYVPDFMEIFEEKIRIEEAHGAHLVADNAKLNDEVYFL